MPMQLTSWESLCLFPYRCSACTVVLCVVVTVLPHACANRIAQFHNRQVLEFNNPASTCNSTLEAGQVLMPDYLPQSSADSYAVHTTSNVSVVRECSTATYDCVCLIRDCHESSEESMQATSCTNYAGPYKPPKDQLWAMTLGGVMACLVAYGIGAGDAATSWGTSVGTGAIQVKPAAIMGAVMEVLGAVFMGYGVSAMIGKGILQVEDPDCWACGYCDSKMGGFPVCMCSALIGTFCFLVLSTITSMPAATVHAIIGGVVGGSVVFTGWSCMTWNSMNGLSTVVLGWLVSPLLSGMIGGFTIWMLHWFVLKNSFPFRAAAAVVPVCYFITTFTSMTAVAVRSRFTMNIHPSLQFGIPALLAAFVAILSACLLWPRLSTYHRRSSGGTDCVYDDDDGEYGVRDEDAYYAGDKAQASKSSFGSGSGKAPLSSSDVYDTSRLEPGGQLGDASQRSSSTLGDLPDFEFGTIGQVSTACTGWAVEEENEADGSMLVTNTYFIQLAEAYNSVMADIQSAADDMGKYVEDAEVGTAHRHEEGGYHYHQAFTDQVAALEGCSESDPWEALQYHYIPEEARIMEVDRPELLAAEQRDAVWAFRYLLVYQAAWESFAHGANDTANAAGPFIAIYNTYVAGVYDCQQEHDDVWIMALSGAFVALGVLTFGYRVIQTIAIDVADINFMRCWAMEFSSTFVVFVATMVNLPVSTNHCQVGAVLLVTLVSQGVDKVSWGWIMRVVLASLITIACSALISGLVALGLRELIRI